jgi:hypothetical protein
MTEFTPEKTSHEARLTSLEKKRGKGKASRSVDTAIAEALKRSAHRGDDPAKEEFREDLFEELRKLIKPAVEQAKKGKPALLRLLTRSTR